MRQAGRRETRSSYWILDVLDDSLVGLLLPNVSKLLDYTCTQQLVGEYRFLRKSASQVVPHVTDHSKNSQDEAARLEEVHETALFYGRTYLPLHGGRGVRQSDQVWVIRQLVRVAGRNECARKGNEVLLRTCDEGHAFQKPISLRTRTSWFLCRHRPDSQVRNLL